MMPIQQPTLVAVVLVASYMSVAHVAPASTEAGPPLVQGPPAPSPAVVDLITRLKGAYTGKLPGLEERPADVALHISPIPSADLAPTLYVEMTRYGGELKPIVRQIWTPYERAGKPRIRVSEFPEGTTFGDVYTGAWAYPDMFPKVLPSRLEALCDLLVTNNDGALDLRTPGPAPIGRDGAMELEMEVRLAGDDLTWRATGFDGEGRPIWGEAPLALRRVEPPVAASFYNDGLVLIDLRPGVGPKADIGDAIAIDFDGYTMSGQKFYSTKWPGLTPVNTPLPSQFMFGWNEGIIGMQEASVRRIIVPPELCVGPDGKPTPGVPENTWLIFDLEMLAVKDNTPDNTGADAGKPPPAQDPFGEPPPAGAPPPPADAPPETKPVAPKR